MDIIVQGGFYSYAMANQVLHVSYLVTSNVNGFSINQVLGHTDASKSNESDIVIYETLDEQQKDQTGEKYPGNTSQQEDPIYHDIDKKSYETDEKDYETANQENNQNKHSDGKVQNYASINFNVPESYQTLRSSFSQNQVNEQESDNKSNNDHYASLTETKEKSYEHLPKIDAQNDSKISFQLKLEITNEESGSTSPLYKTLQTFGFDDVHS